MQPEDIERELVISTLRKIYWIEARMEELLLWETLIESGGEAKQALDTLIRDSEKHRILIGDWLNRLGIKLPESPPAGLSAKAFDFSGKELPEMWKEILKYEILMKGQYENLLGAECEQGIKLLIPDEKEREEFVSHIKELINAESTHMEICRQSMGAFRRIIGK